MVAETINDSCRGKEWWRGGQSYRKGHTEPSVSPLSLRMVCEKNRTLKVDVGRRNLNFTVFIPDIFSDVKF